MSRAADDRSTDGGAAAAFLAAGFGAFATGAFVLLDQLGWFAAPALYAPAGGVTGRTAFAVVAWLLAWLVLHLRWRRRRMAPGRPFALALLLTVLGIAACFPPLWSLLP